MNSDIRFIVTTEHAVTRDFPRDQILYGQLCGPVISGDFSGSQMIKVLACPEWAPYKYDDQFAGRLVPTALISHDFDFPIYDATGKVRKFLLYVGSPEWGQSETGDKGSLIASSESYADILEHAYAHARYIQDSGSYKIVNLEKMKPVSRAFFYPDDADKSWVWEAAK